MHRIGVAEACERLGDRVVILSPHLDDTVICVGSFAARAARRGVRVRSVTVLAGDPKSEDPAGSFDAEAGFRSKGDAARRRREEDARSCGIMGIEPSWLPFADQTYERGGTDEDVRAALQPFLADATGLLFPGFPLDHPDHLWLARLVLAMDLPGVALACYVEQPYAVKRLLGREALGNAPAQTLLELLVRRRIPAGAHPHVAPEIDVLLAGRSVTWVAVSHAWGSWWLKRRAIRLYVSQVPLIGKLLHTRIALYEWALGGEAVGFVEGRPG